VHTKFLWKPVSGRGRLKSEVLTGGIKEVFIEAGCENLN
jgi:hypothetical protein